MAYEHTENTARLVLGFISIFLGSTLASAGGIGGGGVIGGILLVVFEFSWKDCVVLALSAVAGSTLAQTVVNFRKRHPINPSRPLIYWDAVAILLPPQLGGAALGVFIVTAFPSSILVVIAILVLTFALVKVLLKGRRLWKRETSNSETVLKEKLLYTPQRMSIDSQHSEQEQRVIEDMEVLQGYQQGLQANHEVVVGVGSIMSREVSIDIDPESAQHASPLHTPTGKVLPSGQRDLRLQNPTAIELTNDQRVPAANSEVRSPAVPRMPTLQVAVVNHQQLRSPIEYPWLTLKVVFGLWVVYACLILLARSTSISPPCSTTFFVILSLSFLLLAAATAWAISRVAADQLADPKSCTLGDIDFVGALKQQQGSYALNPIASDTGSSPFGNMHNQVPYKFKWSQLTPSCLAFIIGILCSLLGIGGGELMGPLMLFMGFLPQVQSATTSVMSLAIAVINTIHYGVEGRLNWSWSLYLFSAGLLGGVAGRRLSFVIVSKTGRPSIIVFMLAAILLISNVLLIEDLSSAQNDNFTHWSGLCTL